MCVDRPSLDVGSIPPNPFEKRIPRLHATCTAGQIEEQAELERGQENLFALNLDPMRGNVDDEIAQRDHLRAFDLGRGIVRRRIASTRSTSSRGLNGFVT